MMRCLRRSPDAPASIAHLPPYFDDPIHIEALRANLAGNSAIGFRARALLLSFHGMPQRTLNSAILIIAIARRPRGCSARRLAGRSMSRSSRGSGAQMAGAGHRPTLAAYRQASSASDRGAGFPPIASKHWKSSASAACNILGAGEPFCAARLPQRSTRSMTMLEQLVARELEGWRSAP